ncbi:hypothetical protein RND81_03G093300 [Saponaria officinalis]|uniref:peroxidase n=1 Tax=Saponaria officinalis TaxID=3572 RepID=A0AAW1LZA4_SAPOF
MKKWEQGVELVVSTLLALFQPVLMLLNVDYYQQSCLAAISIVKKAVYRSLSANPNPGVGLIRLHFHDCFVRGCDASVLLKSIPRKESEMDSVANTGLKGFEVVEAAKQVVEAQCPGVVSYADIILPLPARDGAGNDRENHLITTSHAQGMTESYSLRTNQ